MEKRLSARLGGKVKVTQSMRELRFTIFIKGNLDKTSELMRKIDGGLEREFPVSTEVYSDAAPEAVSSV